MAYLSELLEVQTLSIEEFKLFIENLRYGKITNPLNGSSSQLNSEKQIHFKNIENLISNEGLDGRRLLQLCQSKWEELTGIRERREDIKEETEIIFKKRKFHEIGGGRFIRGGRIEDGEVFLSHTIEVMDAPVTQFQWIEIMQENPSRFKKGEDQVEIMVDGESIQLQPDNPVENITWWSAIDYANRLSKKQ